MWIPGLKGLTLLLFLAPPNTEYIMFSQLAVIINVLCHFKIEFTLYSRTPLFRSPKGNGKKVQNSGVSK